VKRKNRKRLRPNTNNTNTPSSWKYIFFMNFGIFENSRIVNMSVVCIAHDTGNLRR